MPSVRRAAGGLLGLTFVIAGGAGCRHTVDPAAMEPEQSIPQIELRGPKCCEGGPSVEILKAERHPCAKGSICTAVDLRIRNPEERALFLLDDGARPFAGYLTSVNIIDRGYGAATPPVWEFSGQLAFKLPPGADVVIRNLDLTQDLHEFVAVFLDRIALNYDRHIDSTDPEGLMPAQGEFDMSWIRRGFIDDYQSRPLYSLAGKERVAIDTWCVQKVPAPR